MGLPYSLNQGGRRSASPHVQAVALLQGASEALGSVEKTLVVGSGQQVWPGPTANSCSDFPTLLPCAGLFIPAVRLGCPSVPLGSHEKRAGECPQVLAPAWAHARHDLTSFPSLFSAPFSPRPHACQLSLSRACSLHAETPSLSSRVLLARNGPPALLSAC